jgi:adenylate cyclase
VNLAVAFADLVGFTEASDYLSALEVGEVANSFMRCAEDTLPDHGARIVKGIGDAVMFTAPDPVTASASAHALLRAAARDQKLPPVRVGVAHGPVLRRAADYFGRTVNLASRLSAAAHPGSVLVAEPEKPPSADAWKKAGLRVARRRKISVKGLAQRVSVLEVVGTSANGARPR